MNIELIIFIFMIIAGVICLLSLVMGISDFVKERKNKKAEKLNQQERERKQEEFVNNILDKVNESIKNESNLIKMFVVEELAKVQTEKVIIEKQIEVACDKLKEEVKPEETKMIASEEPKELKPEISEQKSVVLTEDSVVFSSNKKMTLEEKYNNLSNEYKEYYDELASYAFTKNNVKVIENDRYEEYKIGNNKLVKFEIKRDIVIASFVLVDAELRQYARENKVAIKPKATSIKVKTEDDVKFVKDSIDMVEKSIEEELVAKKELQKQKRKLKALEKKQLNK